MIAPSFDNADRGTRWKAEFRTSSLLVLATGIFVSVLGYALITNKVRQDIKIRFDALATDRPGKFRIALNVIFRLFIRLADYSMLPMSFPDAIFRSSRNRNFRERRACRRCRGTHGFPVTVSPVSTAATFMAGSRRMTG